MPVHPDFQKVRDAMREQYGKKKGDEVYYSYLNKNDLDDSKPMPKKIGAEADDLGRNVKQDPKEDPQNIGKDDFAVPLKASGEIVQPPYQQGTDSPEDSIGGGDDSPDQHDALPYVAKAALHIPAYKFRYSAAPIDGSAGDMLISALVLEPGQNINGWEVDPVEFQSVANQYAEGRQLRTNHSDKVEQVFGKSFEGKAILGKDVQQFLGYAVEGIIPDATYVGAKFKATPKDPQVRINLEKGYVDTGSIGLDANAYCKQCNLPVEVSDLGEVSRSCNHLNASVILRNVDVKEYSYVAEPAFSHSKIFPSFAAAVNSALKSSLMQSSEKSAPMSVKSTVQAKAGADAGNTIDDAKMYTQAEADAYAEARMAIYKKGLMDAAKFRADYQQPTNKDPPTPVDPGWKGAADAEAKPDAEADASAAGGFKDQPAGGAPATGFAPMRGQASVKTDQIGKTNATAQAPKPMAKDDLMAIAFRPTEYAARQNPEVWEIFKAAANHPDAPVEIKNRYRGVFK